jgi:hypothetical protein
MDITATDPLEMEIATKREEVADLQRRLERMNIELATLERAAMLRPFQPASDVHLVGMNVKRRPRGRMPGALSHQWRQILGVMVQNGNHFVSPPTVSALAEIVGIRVGPKTAADRLARYVGKGFTERSGETYRVTMVAMTRFGLYSGPTKALEPRSEVPSSAPASSPSSDRGSIEQGPPAPEAASSNPAERPTARV